MSHLVRYVSNPLFTSYELSREQLKITPKQFSELATRLINLKQIPLHIKMIQSLI
jgi:hypothetical protein